MVYIANNKGYNYEDARQYGELKDITSGPQPIYDLDEIKRRIIRGLKGFDVNNDYILCSGSAWILMIVASYMAGKPVKYLVFDAVNRKYLIQNLGGM